MEPIGPFGNNRIYRANWADGTNWPNWHQLMGTNIAAIGPVQESSMSVCMTTAGVKYVSMYDSCRSHAYICMTPPGVKYVSMQDSCRSQVSQCMTPAGVKYLQA